MSFNDFFWLLSPPTLVSHSQRFLDREDVFSGFFYSPLLQMSRGYEDQHSLMRRSSSVPGAWAGFLSQNNSNGI
ncbi:hypothetical protein HID58_055414 [Brassica napus]|uniref:Uncharacterized protein n=1 Tax=Brassica napus TaxID=3708 RepID=A0ABQ8AKG3_BRANA|nr:hypothetical protein HID58_055406 [Brassica napus]KAH0892985.1 hypothetical protein HID58_055414 [Brassica napus]